MITTDHQIHFRPGRHSNKQIASGPAKRKAPGRIPHVSKLMDLAIQLDQLIRDGQVTDQAELARLGYVSRARLTQIMIFLWLSPDLQEQILFLRPTERGRDTITERELRPIAAMPSWSKQRAAWKNMAAAPGREEQATRSP